MIRRRVDGLATALLCAALWWSGSSGLRAQPADRPGAVSGGRPLVAPGPDSVRRPAAGRPPTDTLTLQQAVDLARARRPVLRAHRMETSASATARRAAWGAFLPTASLRMGMSRRDVTRNTFVSEEGIPRRLDERITFVSKSVRQTLSVRWTLLAGGQRIARLRAASAAGEASRYRSAEAEREVELEVRTAYYAARKLERLVEIAEDQLDSHRRVVEEARRRYRTAAVDRWHLLGALVETRAARVRLHRALEAADRGRRRLRLAIGAGRAGEAGARDFALAPVPALPKRLGLSASLLVRRALRAHPELRALDAEVDEASARVRAATARYLPTVAVSYSRTRRQELGEEGSLLTFDPRDRVEGTVLTASWSVFTGFRRGAESTRARTEFERARAERARRRSEIASAVRAGVEEIERRRRRLELLREQVEWAEERLRLLRGRLRLGLATVADVARAVDAASAARRDAVRERWGYRIARATLERWTGRTAPEKPGGDTGRVPGPE